MSKNGLTEILARVMQARDLDASLYADAVSALQAAFPDENYEDADDLAARDPATAVMHLVNTQLPEWSISIKGKAHETDGDWSCTLRKSDVHDDDLFVGTGTGPKLPLAMMAAFLKLSLARASQ